MIVLPTDLLAEIRAHDGSRNDAAGARSTLERALVYQARAVADGLLADMVSLDLPVLPVMWWQQYLSRYGPTDASSPKVKDALSAAYRERFVQRIATGAVRPIPVGEYEDTPVRVYGGTFRFGDEGRINRQLATLGSSMRLLVIGSHQRRARRAQALLLPALEAHVPSPPPEGRFLFGAVAPVTRYDNAALFVFYRELALSPHVEPEASGFVDGARIVVRRLAQNVAEGGQPCHDERSGLSSIVRHQFVHSLVLDASVSPSASGRAAWWNTLREDLLRFTKSPRTIDDVRDSFDFYVGESMANDKPRLAQAPSGPSVRGLVDSLIADRLLFTDNDGRYFSTIYRSGQPWNL